MDSANWHDKFEALEDVVKGLQDVAKGHAGQLSGIWDAIAAHLVKCKVIDAVDWVGAGLDVPGDFLEILEQ